MNLDAIEPNISDPGSGLAKYYCPSCPAFKRFSDCDRYSVTVIKKKLYNNYIKAPIVIMLNYP
tara:strand:+ start:2051 stop:2239 length:189 start_codon:yes stop_codon:yes gene_type:complete